jgi:hypothetical protein
MAARVQKGASMKRQPTLISRAVFFLVVLAILVIFGWLFPAHASPRTVGGTNVTMISNPSGCPATKFCACGLAKYWGIWKRDLNKVSEWARHFQRASGPGVGVAAVRRDNHHVIGIVGGGPGAWRVVDFNSGGHASRTYTASSFPGYYFLAVRG